MKCVKSLYSGNNLNQLIFEVTVKSRKLFLKIVERQPGHEWNHEFSVLKKMNGKSDKCFPQVVDQYVHEQKDYLLFEFIEGGSLDKAIKEKKFQKKDIRPFFANLLRCVKILHDEGFVHSDFKP